MRTFIALAIVTIAEASIGIFVKLTGDAVPIFTLNFYRVAFAAVFLAITLPLFSRVSLKYPRNNTKDILVIGALVAAQISLFNIAMSLAPIANVVIFWSVAPFFVFIFSSLYLREKPRLSHIFIFLIAFTGILLAEPVSLVDGLWTEQNIGNLIALFDGAVYAAMVVYIRKEGKTEANVDIFWFMLAAAVYLSPALWFSGIGELFATSSAPAFAFEVPVLVWVLGLGLFSTGLAFLFISIVLKTINANVYSLVDIVVSPVIAAVLAYFIFFEQPSAHTIIGGIILLTSGAWLTYTMRTDTKPEEEKPVPGK